MSWKDFRGGILRKKINGLVSFRFLCAAVLALSVTSTTAANQVVSAFPAQPSVDEPNSRVSFWRDQVHYPFPIHYAKASDGQGTEWEVAYMDEYAGPPLKKSAARTLILIHGRGTNAATWGALMQAALRSGLRVIALDIPHYGKSIPGNVDKPLTRTLDDVRDVFYKIIVGQLNIKKAVYLGHSLGGQLVFGYAVKYPAAVERLIAVAPGGLEEFRPSILFDPAYQRDLQQWKKAWQATSALEREFRRPAYMIELDYYFQGDGRNRGYFLKDGVVPRFITDVRKSMISGNEQEYKNYITSYIHDGYAAGVELLQDNPNNLRRRIAGLKMPIFLALGERDPFFPEKFASGNSDVKLDLIKPLFDELRANGNAPQVKIYQEVGHFIFTDIPQQFDEDVLKFVDGKPLSNLENAAEYKMTLLRWLGLQKKMNNILTDLMMDCYESL